jgi:hypothetical protein
VLRAFNKPHLGAAKLIPDLNASRKPVSH